MSARYWSRRVSESKVIWQRSLKRRRGPSQKKRYGQYWRWIKPILRLKKGTINVKVPADVYHRYFSEVDDREVQKILVEALGLYFMAKGE